MDWETVVPRSKLNYIMGNPPFVGKKEQSKKQKTELMALYSPKAKGIGNLDYVTGWYIKAAKIMEQNFHKIGVCFDKLYHPGGASPAVLERIAVP